MTPIEGTAFPVLEAHEFHHAGLRCVVAMLAAAPTPMWVGYVEVPILVGVEQPKHCTFRDTRFPLWCPLTVRTGHEVFGWDGWAHHPRTTDRVIDSLEAAVARTREFAGSPAGPKGFPTHDVERAERAPEPIDCPSCGGDGYHEDDDGEGMARAYECGTCLGKEKIEPFDSKPLWGRWHAVPKDREGLTLRLIACALRSADDCWESTQDRSLGCSTQDENAECLRDTVKVIEEALAGLEKPRRTHVDIVFTGPPGPQHDACCFIEVEYDGRGIGIGEWLDRPDGHVALRITPADVAAKGEG